MLDEILFKYRFLIGAFLLLVIIAGSGILLWGKISQSQKQKENQTIVELKTENERLRQELSKQEETIAQPIGAEQKEKININTADLSGLDKLPGIGQVRAQDIINYRQSHNGFSSIEEIKNIKGIGEKSFQQLENLITTGN